MRDNSKRAERWNVRQARVLLDSLCLELEADERLEGGDITLAEGEDCLVVRCNKCGEEWEVDSIALANGALRVQAFVPWGLGYRYFYRCPCGCNKDYSWDKDALWCSVLAEID
jgi:hypothetical protein